MSTVHVERTNPAKDIQPIERAVLSAELGDPIYEPVSITVATFEGYRVQIHRLDGEAVERFELSGLEVERLIRAYRIHARRYSRLMSTLAETALDDLDGHPF